MESTNKSIKDNQKKIDELYTKYGTTISAYEEYLERHSKLIEDYEKLKAKLSELLSGALEEVNKTIWSGNQLIDDNTKFDKLNERNNKIQEKMNDIKEKEEARKDQRKENINNLYNEISYVEYDDKTYNESLDIIKDTLNTILTKSDNESLNKDVKSYLSLIEKKGDILPAENSIKNLEKQYYAIVDEIQKNNKNFSDLVKNDYEKFLYSISNNNISLVNNTDISTSLSTNLFEINEDYLYKLKNQENINKLYLDYHNQNIEWYLNAINNYSAQELNMDAAEYDKSKKYLTDISEKTKLAYNIIENQKLITQNSQNNNVWLNNAWWSSYVDVSNYINVIKTPEWSVNLSNKEYVKTFQWKSILTDINKDWKNDLILWDLNNIYIKYKDGNRSYDNQRYNNKYYKYSITSYNKLLNDSEAWFVKINNIYLKICDQNREVKNFKYNWWDFDNIKINWLNSKILWDDVKWYLIKMIHRADLFNDKEKIVINSNRDFFDKKYILVLPKWASLTGTKIWIEEWIFNTEDLLTGTIIDVLYYNENQDKIDLTIKEIPRNWQYSQIYTLNIENENIYYISSPSSNQIVWWPQLIWDTRWPNPTIKIFRPSIQQDIDEWEVFDLYVSTRYTIKADREDNVSLDKLWISDSDWNIIKEQNDINNKTGYIELSNLYFTWAAVKNYYFVWVDTNGNMNSTQVTLNIKKPNIEIININKYGNEIANISSPATITAEVSNDVDEAYVQFLRNRNGNWEVITGTMWWIEIDKYKLNPLQTIVTGWYYDFGNDIWLYLADWNLAAKINPKNGKISIENGFENIVKLSLDYSMKVPMVKVSDKNNRLIFGISFSSVDLVGIETNLEVREIYWDTFGEFNNGKAIIQNNEVLMYVSPKWKIYVDNIIYGDYSFDQNTESVVYSFRKTESWPNLWNIKIKVKNLLWE